MAAAEVLQDSRAIITGGAGDIGLATAMAFAAEGARVALFDIDAGRGAAGVQAIQEAGGSASFHRVDMTEAAGVEAAVIGAAETMGGLNILVNVVGGSGRRWGDGPTADCTVEGWERTLALNLTSVFLSCKYAIPLLLDNDSSAIVNVSSVLGLVGGDEDFATHAYAASKGGIISLTRSIATYYAAQNLRANVIAPGLIATQMSQRAQESEKIQARLGQLQPLGGGFGQPDDVAQAALYLASDRAKFVTGAVLAVDGGWTAR
jgi:NAD(P)-dependent dehydrogenase (short-subunit alcohol dehydrogenase family)